MDNLLNHIPTSNLVVDVTSSKDVIIGYTEPTSKDHHSSFDWRGGITSFIRQSSRTSQEGTQRSFKGSVNENV